MWNEIVEKLKYIGCKCSIHFIDHLDEKDYRYDSENDELVYCETMTCRCEKKYDTTKWVIPDVEEAPKNEDEAVGIVWRRFREALVE